MADRPRVTALHGAAVGLFLVATAESFNVFSAMTSSPWTAASFGADPHKASLMRRYVAISVAANEALGAGASLLAQSWWPLLGTTVVSGFMWWVYQDALRRGNAAQGRGWGTGFVALPGGNMDPVNPGISHRLGDFLKA